MLEINKIHCGDAFELLKEIPDKSIDIVITDPPYGMNFVSNHRITKHKPIYDDDSFPVEILEELFRIAKKAVYIFCRWDNLSEIPKPRSVLAWVKNNWSMGDLKHEHGRQWEAIAFYPMEEHEFIKRIPDVIKANRTGNHFHPTEKPISLIRDILLANKGNSVLDCFMGSGTTAVVCKQLGKDFIGIEIDKEYCEIARRRVKQTAKPLFT